LSTTLTNSKIWSLSLNLGTEDPRSKGTHSAFNAKQGVASRVNKRTSSAHVTISFPESATEQGVPGHPCCLQPADVVVCGDWQCSHLLEQTAEPPLWTLSVQLAGTCSTIQTVVPRLSFRSKGSLTLPARKSTMRQTGQMSGRVEAQWLHNGWNQSLS
jgi:hypothetical protein